MQRLRVSAGVESSGAQRVLMIADRMTDTCPLVSSSLPMLHARIYRAVACTGVL